MTAGRWETLGESFCSMERFSIAKNESCGWVRPHVNSYIVGKTIIILFMVIWGMVHYCFNMFQPHITTLTPSIFLWDAIKLSTIISIGKNPARPKVPKARAKSTLLSNWSTLFKTTYAIFATWVPIDGSMGRAQHQHHTTWCMTGKWWENDY